METGIFRFRFLKQNAAVQKEKDGNRYGSAKMVKKQKRSANTDNTGIYDYSTYLVVCFYILTLRGNGEVQLLQDEIYHSRRKTSVCRTEKL